MHRSRHLAEKSWNEVYRPLWGVSTGLRHNLEIVRKITSNNNEWLDEINPFNHCKMAFLVNRLRLKEVLKVPVRYKNPPHHWSVLRRKNTPKDKALEHFDKFYGSVYGDGWADIRTALLEEDSKYMAIVNNYSDTERVRSELELLGAIHLKTLYDSRKEHVVYTRKSKKPETTESENVQNPIETFISSTKLSEVQSVYPSDHENVLQALRAEDTNSDTKSEEDDELNESKKAKDALESAKMRSIDEELNESEMETDRIIDSSVNLNSLYEYVPATKIKGLNDFVLESDHYGFYNRGGEFSVNVVKESVLPFPEHLHAYAFERGNYSRFPSPKKGSTGVLDYYLFDGTSILPVLALDIQPGDVVLDTCAAPGGKALTILQTLMPHVVVANDLMESRVNRIHKVVDQYLGDLQESEKVLYVTTKDARAIEDKHVFNKILVDVPCTTDRHILHSDENNLFKPGRIKERLQIAEVQSQILINALRLISVGGTVVYATCSLSPIQNDGVVHVALKKVWEETESVMVVKDMSEALKPLKYLFKFANVGLKYGHIAVPSKFNNWGPMYFCKIDRLR